MVIFGETSLFFLRGNLFDFNFLYFMYVGVISFDEEFTIDLPPDVCVYYFYLKDFRDIGLGADSEYGRVLYL